MSLQAIFSTNIVDDSGLDGLHLIVGEPFPPGQTAGDGIPVNGSDDLLAEFNLITDSGNDGIEFDLDGVQGFPDIKFRDNTIIGFGGLGTNVHAVGGTIGSLSFDPLVFSSEFGAEGIVLDLKDTQLASGVLFDRVTVDGSTSAGITVRFDGVTGNTDIEFRGPSSITNSADSGVVIELIDTVDSIDATDITIDGFTSIDNSNGSGIEIRNINTDLGDVRITNNNISRSNNGDGIQANLTGSLNLLLLDNNTISGSSASGINLMLNGVTGNPTVGVTNNSVDDSGLLGISVEGIDLNDVLFENNDVTD